MGIIKKTTIIIRTHKIKVSENNVLGWNVRIYIFCQCQNVSIKLISKLIWTFRDSGSMNYAFRAISGRFLHRDYNLQFRSDWRTANVTLFSSLSFTFWRGISKCIYVMLCCTIRRMRIRNVFCFVLLMYAIKVGFVYVYNEFEEWNIERM